MTQVPAQMQPIQAIRHTLEIMRKEFSAVLPPQIAPDRFVRTCLTAIQLQPALMQADRRSLYAAIMRSAQDGLFPDGRDAALVIYRTKEGPRVQYMPMIAGLLKKLRQSGGLASISAHVVYEGDVFEYCLGDDEAITHRPQLGGDAGKPIAAYAIAKMRDGSIWREVMSVEQIEKVRNVSRASNSGPWVSFWSEMARKTVLRRLMKRLPSSSDLDQVTEADNETFDYSEPQEQPATPAPTSIEQKILGHVEEEEPTEEAAEPEEVVHE